MKVRTYSSKIKLFSLRWYYHDGDDSLTASTKTLLQYVVHSEYLRPLLSLQLWLQLRCCDWCCYYRTTTVLLLYCSLFLIRILPWSWYIRYMLFRTFLFGFEEMIDSARSRYLLYLQTILLFCSLSFIYFVDDIVHRSVVLCLVPSSGVS